MKKLMIAAAALMIAVAAHAQGQFTFNTRGANNIKFVGADGATALSGDNYFVQVFAGASVDSLAAIPGAVLPLNQTGARAGYTNPTIQSFEVPGLTGNAFIGYQAYQGAASGIASATTMSPLVKYKNGAASGAAADALTVALVLPPNLPNEVALGTANVALVPEPTTMVLGLVGLGALLAFRRRQ